MLIPFATPKQCGPSANFEDWKSDVDRRTMIVRQDLGKVMGKHFQLNCLLVFALYVAFVKLLIYTSSLLFTEAYADKLLACVR